MAARGFLRFFIFLLAGPFVFLSRIAELVNAWKIRDEIEACIEAVDAFGEQVPPVFVSMLIAAEDHRSHLHPGVDPIAILRALYVRVWQRTLQGASTIEQQFVRVITNHRERTISRKLREQILAIAVSRRRAKYQIASAYLACAFYGTECVGLAGLKIRCGAPLDQASTHSMLSMIARLKYPEPAVPSVKWQRKHRARMDYIIGRRTKAYNATQPISFSSTPFTKRCRGAESNLAI
jgi:penicillin-binding protein 1A